MTAKAKRQRVGKPGSLEDCRALLWQALRRAGELTGSEDAALALKACHAVSQGAASYTRLLEAGELAARLDALEVVAEAAKEDGPRMGQRRAG